MILAFYPGDFTPVCTRQFCSYRDAADHLDDLDADVLGISPQSVSSHERFAAEHGLTVPLLADPDHATARAYGVVAPGGLVRRSIFIIDPEGTVRYRHAALLGLRYKDVEHLAVALALARDAAAGPVSGEPTAFAVERDGAALRGEAAGEGHPIALLHGLTATRRYVVHGSRALARSGFRTLAYDARGHGESDPAPGGHGIRLRPSSPPTSTRCSQPQAGARPYVLAGHSMGAHTLAAHALANPSGARGDRRHRSRLPGHRGDRRVARLLGRARRRARAGRRRRASSPPTTATSTRTGARRMLRITRERLRLHRHPEAVAEALREVPRSRPFEDLSELEFLDVPGARRRQPRRRRSRAPLRGRRGVGGSGCRGRP